MMASLGEELRGEREARGLTIEEVEASLKIQAHYLEAVESGESSMVSDEYYAVPFVRQYADFLGMDPAEAVARYVAETARRQRRAPTRHTSPPAFPRAWLVGLGLVLAGVAALAWWYAWPR